MVKNTSCDDRKRKRTSDRKTVKIQLIEADLQLLMRISVSARNKGRIEVDEIISKRNYRSRSGYYMQDKILEKRLVFDNSLVTGRHNIYALTDLQVACDMQLSK